MIGDERVRSKSRAEPLFERVDCKPHLDGVSRGRVIFKGMYVSCGRVEVSVREPKRGWRASETSEGVGDGVGGTADVDSSGGGGDGGAEMKLPVVVV